MVIVVFMAERGLDVQMQTCGGGSRLRTQRSERGRRGGRVGGRPVTRARRRVVGVVVVVEVLRGQRGRVAAAAVAEPARVVPVRLSRRGRARPEVEVRLDDRPASRAGVAAPTVVVVRVVAGVKLELVRVAPAVRPPAAATAAAETRGRAAEVALLVRLKVPQDRLEVDLALEDVPGNGLLLPVGIVVLVSIDLLLTKIKER